MRVRKHILYLLLTAFAVAPAQAQAPQKKLDATLENLAKSKESEAELKKKLADTERELSDLRERAAGLAEKLQMSERRVTSEETKLESVTTELGAKQREFEARKADYSATVLSLLRMRGMPATALFSAQENTQELMRTASVLEKTNAAVAQKAARLREDMATLRKLRSNAATREASTRAEKTTLAREREALARELAARQKLQSKLSADVAREQQKAAALSRESKSLQELIGKLDADARQRNKATPAKKTAIRAFDGKKGSLRAPVAGNVLHLYGEPQGANGTYRGTVFKARAGATVVAPYDGEVVFTGPFRDYGNMVLIKHKNGYISLIAGIGKVSAALNQPAIRGEPIGTMPETGKLEAYVELRDSSAKPIDPGDWFANVGG
jgi:septal ring factor EnvC (AmiA/AmiB activator)